MNDQIKHLEHLSDQMTKMRLPLRLLECPQEDKMRLAVGMNMIESTLLKLESRAVVRNLEERLIKDAII